MTRYSVGSIGSRLAKFRKSIGKNQIPFAKELGVSQSAYANYERNATEIPLRLAAKLSEEYGLSLDKLIFNRETITPLQAVNALRAVLGAIDRFEKEENFAFSDGRKSELIIYLFEEAISGRFTNDQQMRRVMRIG